MNKILNIAKNLGSKTITNDFPGLASEMAYSFTLSMFPFVIFIVALFGLLGTENVISRIVEVINFVAPTETLNMIREVLNEVIDSRSSGLLGIVGFAGGLWAASRAIMSTMKGMNRAYNIEETRPFWKTNGIAILTVLLLTFVIFISLNLTVFGRVLIDFLTRIFPIPSDIRITVLWIRWPVTLLSIYAITLIIYFFLPNIRKNKKILFKSSSYGALFFSIFWLFGSWLFSLYVENFARYNAVYGTLGAFVVLLIWLYYSSLIMLVGGGLSSEIFKLLKPKIVELRQK